MATLRETVQAKTAVPTSQVYVSIVDVTIQHSNYNNVTIYCVTHCLFTSAAVFISK